MHSNRTNGFTFVEVLVALAVTAISLLGLLRLQLLSMAMAQQAEIIRQATLLAQQKIAETVAQDASQPDMQSGIENIQNVPVSWQIRIAAVKAPQRKSTGTPLLREVCVDVYWPQGSTAKHVQMSTYVADGRPNNRESSENRLYAD